MPRVIIGLGSNVGDRLRFLESAAKELSLFLTGVQKSSVYESAPMYEENQGAFFNSVLIGETEMGPFQLLSFLKGIELKLGRVERWRNGPREIDLDLVDYGGISLHSDRLDLPHPRLLERRFVIEPLLELLPEYTTQSGIKLNALIHNKEIYDQALERLDHAAF